MGRCGDETLAARGRNRGFTPNAATHFGFFFIQEQSYIVFKFFMYSTMDMGLRLTMTKSRVRGFPLRSI